MLSQWTQTFSGINIPAGGGTQTFTITDQSVPLTDGIPGGSCAVSVQVELDYSSTICETVGTNNDYVTAPIPVDAPDLEVNGHNFEVTCNGSGLDTIQGTFSVINSGCTPITGDVAFMFTVTDQVACTGSMEHQWTETIHGLSIAPGGSAILPITPVMVELGVCSSSSPEASIRVDGDTSLLVSELNGHNNEFCGDIVLRHLITATCRPPRSH